MNNEAHHRHFGGLTAQLAFSLALGLALCAGQASAADVPVKCGQGDTVQGALGLLDKTGPNTLTISGVCIESVLVEGFTDLTLQGSQAGDGIRRKAPITNSDYTQTFTALQVKNSEGINIFGLSFYENSESAGSFPPPLVEILRSSATVQGCEISGSASTGLAIGQESNVGIYACMIEGSRGGGLGIGDNSNIDLVGSKIKNNLGGGISAGGHSRLTISNWSYWSPGGDVPTLIEGSGSATDFNYGVNASNGAEVSIGWAEIKDNPGGGVTASNSGRVDLGEWGPHAPIITGNGRLAGPAAVAAGGGGEIWIIPPTAIQDNPANGAIADLGGRLVVCCGDPVHISNNQGFGVRAWGGGSVSFWSSAQVEGNKRGGISLFWGKAYLNRDVLIQQNGDPLDPNSYGGLILEADSSAEGAFAVSNNNGPGVWIKGGSHALFYKDTSITKNRGNGVQLEMDGIAEFNDGNKVSGNKPFDLFCTAGTTVGAPKGAKPSIGKMSCTGWTQFLPLPAWQASER